MFICCFSHSNASTAHSLSSHINSDGSVQCGTTITFAKFNFSLSVKRCQTLLRKCISFPGKLQRGFLMTNHNSFLHHKVTFSQLNTKFVFSQCCRTMPKFDKQLSNNDPNTEKSFMNASKNYAKHSDISLSVSDFTMIVISAIYFIISTKSLKFPNIPISDQLIGKH